MSQILFIEINNKFLNLSEFFLLWLSNTKRIRIHTVFGCSFSLSRECFLNKPLYCENKWLLIPDFSLPVSRLRGFLSFKFTITHYLVPSVIFFFFLCSDNKVNLVWKQNNYAGSVTDTSAECLSCCESVPSFWCVSPCFPLPPPPHPSHGHVGWLSLLASRPTVWDVLPVLQSAGKLWQPYLSWRSLTWKNMWKKLGWRVSQLPRAPSSTAEACTGKKKLEFTFLRN